MIDQYWTLIYTNDSFCSTRLLTMFYGPLFIGTESHCVALTHNTFSCFRVLRMFYYYLLDYAFII